MSKRSSFTEIDLFLPPKLLASYPKHADQLKRISKLEDSIEKFFSDHRRKRFAFNSEPEFKSKILRTYITHQFYPATLDDSAHYIITVEGQLLDSKYKSENSFCSFFDNIKVVIDKKHLQTNNIYEWNSYTVLSGRSADAFRVKIYSDKQLTVKILLTRTSDVKVRYELSSALRHIIPNLRVDPSKEDVLLDLWQYILQNNLLDPKDRKLIRCNSDLKSVFGTETLLVSSLKNKLTDESLHPCPPINIDYVMNPNVTTITSQDRRVSSADITRAGGRVLDLQVDVYDSFGPDILSLNNNVEAIYKDINVAVAPIITRATFLANRVVKVHAELESLADAVGSATRQKRRRTDVYDSDGVASFLQNISDVQTLLHHRPTERNSMGSRLDPLQHPLPINSAVHGSRGFVDVGDESHFNPRRNGWMKRCLDEICSKNGSGQGSS